MPNNSLDRSAGSLFLNLFGAAKVGCNRRAGSTQSLGGGVFGLLKMGTLYVKMLKVSLTGFVICIVLLLVMNRFVFSWTGLIFSKLGFCEYKSIAVPTLNGYNKKLGRSYNIPQIALAMRMNRSYEVNNHYNGDGLVISRVFIGVKYNIIFEDNKGISEFNLNTYNFDGYPSGSVADGERCTTPSYFIERNVYRMIDDLPLDNLHKAELKQHVRVENTVNGKLLF